MSLEKIYQSSQCNFEELKQYLASSPLRLYCEQNSARISKQDQLRVIKDLAILSRVDLLHLKEPSKFFWIMMLTNSPSVWIDPAS